MLWQKVAVCFCAFLGLTGVGGGAVLLASIAYYNITAGPIEPSGGEFRSLDQIALTWQNILRGCCLLVGGITGLAASTYWFRRHRKRAAGFTVLSASLMFVATFLQPPS